MKYFLLILLGLFLFDLNVAEGHPGRTDSHGGHTCYTNCEKWGYAYGQYHYHNSTGSGVTTKNLTQEYNNSNVNSTITNPPIYSKPQKSYNIPASKSQITIYDSRPKNKNYPEVQDNLVEKDTHISSNQPPNLVSEENVVTKPVENQKTTNYSWVLIILVVLSVGTIFLSKK